MVVVFHKTFKFQSCPFFATDLIFYNMQVLHIVYKLKDMKFILLMSAALTTAALGLKIDIHQANSITKDAAKEAACQSSGGKYKILEGSYVCVKNYRDAFKKCANSDQC